MIGSLTARIFAIFWLTLALVLMLVLMLPKLDSRQMTELLDSEQRQGLMIEQHVEAELANDPPNDLMWWRRLFRAIDKWAPPGQRLLLVTTEGRVIGAERSEMQIIRNFIGQADNADHPQKKKYGRVELVGPFSVRDGEDNYQLYLIRPASSSQSDFINLLFDRPLLLLIVTMLVSTPLLLWLAWSLAKPARKLKNAADEVAQGNLRQHPELEAGPQEFLAAGASFNQMVTALERMMTSQQRLLSDISHELRTPLTRFRAGEEPALSLNVPMVSAVMQSVSGDRLAVALAQEGGVSFLYGSQSIEDEAAMVARVKSYKAGFVQSDSNISPDATLADILALREQTGHSTVAVTEDGTADGRLVGIVTSRDYRVSRMDPQTKVREFMTPREKMITAPDGTTLKEANNIIWEHKLNSLPIVNDEGRLCAFVFRKDYDLHKQKPNELLDSQKRYLVGAGINTRDYAERVPALVEAGVDVLVIDSSEGYSEWQKRTIAWIRERYGESVKVGAGNVVDADGFRFLADCGADFVKVGIGGGSICITRETKGIGRGQATAVIDVCRARDEYFRETGIYVPVCSDGGIVHDHHITLALAMGADFVMLGRYFARFDESPSDKVNVNGTLMKEYWGEGSNRARNWQRYDLGGGKKLSFEEGVDSYVPYAGKLSDNVQQTLAKVRSTMCNCGALTIRELQEKARLTLVSSVSIVEGGAHDVVLKTSNKQV